MMMKQNKDNKIHIKDSPPLQSFISVRTEPHTMASVQRTFLLFSIVFMWIVLVPNANALPVGIVPNDKDVVVDVSPFFKLFLRREPSMTVLDIDVMSGLVKVGYDRFAGQKPNVDVQVFGMGTYRNRFGNGFRPTTPPTVPDDFEVDN